MRMSDRVRAEVVLEYWRTKTPTSEIAQRMGIDEAEVCRIIEDSDKREGQS